MFVRRPFWEQAIESAWKERSIIWLMGVRRVGKTSLCKTLPDITYFDCELPRTRLLLNDPEDFLRSHRGQRIILDEIHRLENPSEILKIAADHYSDVKIVATGSSTLGASSKFRDTLTGRKREIWLTPLLLSELQAFGIPNIRHRFLYGGLPSFFLHNTIPETDFREWIDGYWAKDIQELFKVEKRHSFQKFTELLLAHNGGQFEATSFTGPCEVTRQTITNYLEILEETFVVHILRPYSTHKTHEITKAPKIYGFDTGFSCYTRGWRELRPEDMGILWEQCVLNELHAHLQERSIRYWRTKTGAEIDFVIPGKQRDTVTAIECKFSINRILQSPAGIMQLTENFRAFRDNYPAGDNFVAAHDIDQPFTRTHQDITITCVNPSTLVTLI